MTFWLDVIRQGLDDVTIDEALLEGALPQGQEGDTILGELDTDHQRLVLLVQEESRALNVMTQEDTPLAGFATLGAYRQAVEHQEQTVSLLKSIFWHSLCGIFEALKGETLAIREGWQVVSTPSPSPQVRAYVGTFDIPISGMGDMGMEEETTEASSNGQATPATAGN